MYMWQDPIGTYRMKGDIRWDPNLGQQKDWEKKIVNGYNTVYLLLVIQFFRFSLSLFSFHCDLFSSLFLLSFFSFRTSFRLCVIDSHDDYIAYIYIQYIYIHVVFPLLFVIFISVSFVLLRSPFSVVVFVNKDIELTHTRAHLATRTPTFTTVYSDNTL